MAVVKPQHVVTELPWDEPTFSCTEYTAWKDKDCRLFTTTPWTKIDNLALSLLRKVGDTKLLIHSQEFPFLSQFMPLAIIKVGPRKLVSN